jgi:hypothetical protein
MKKSIIIFFAASITLSLMAFGAIHWNGSETDQLEKSESNEVAIKTPALEKMEKRIFTDFIYDVGTRFNPIKKSDLDTIRSFNDIIGQEHAQRIVEYKLVTVILIINDEQSNIREAGSSDVFTATQLKFLHALDYSTNLMIWADYQGKNKKTGALEDTSWTPYLTIVPERQAEYINGKEGLMEFLKENVKDAVVKANVIAEKLKPAKLFFTVTKNETIENVILERSSNYLLVDEKMIELIKKTAKKWQSAENFEGDKVDQELVVSFGLMGC